MAFKDETPAISLCFSEMKQPFFFKKKIKHCTGPTHGADRLPWCRSKGHEGGSPSPKSNPARRDRDTLDKRHGFRRKETHEKTSVKARTPRDEPGILDRLL